MALAVRRLLRVALASLGGSAPRGRLSLDVRRRLLLLVCCYLGGGLRALWSRRLGSGRSRAGWLPSGGTLLEGLRLGELLTGL